MKVSCKSDSPAFICSTTRLWKVNRDIQCSIDGNVNIWGSVRDVAYHFLTKCNHFITDYEQFADTGQF